MLNKDKKVASRIVKTEVVLEQSLLAHHTVNMVYLMPFDCFYFLLGQMY